MTIYNRIRPDRLADRLDAIYYHPSFIENEDRLLRSRLAIVQFKNLVHQGRRCVYFSTTTLERDEAPNTWVPFLTADDLGEDGFFVDLDARRRVSPDFASRYSHGRLRANELLVKVKGPNQTTAYVEHAPDQPILISGTIWGGLVRRDKIDPHYLVTLLSCPYAAIARSRLRTNTNIEFLAAGDLLGLQLPATEARSAQTYIGDKVRQAEKLRARAQESENDVRIKFESYFRGFVPIALKHNYRMSPNEIVNRFDAWYYNPRFLHAQRAIQQAGSQLVPLGELAELITNGGTPSGATFGTDGIPWIRGKDFEHGDINTESIALIDNESEGSIERSRLEIGDIILSIKGTVGDVAVIDETLRGFNINQDVARIQLGDLEKSHFIAFFLESTLGQVLIEQQVYGAVNAFFSLENLRLFPVPHPDSIDQVFKSEVAEYRKNFVNLRRFSKKLLTTAKLLVEALIEGKLTEEELKTAQEALARGDREPDRAILARLTRKGIDALGEPPLFHDLDALYEALDQIEANVEKEGERK